MHMLLTAYISDSTHTSLITYRLSILHMSIIPQTPSPIQVRNAPLIRQLNHPLRLPRRNRYR